METLFYDYDTEILWYVYQLFLFFSLGLRMADH